MDIDWIVWDWEDDPEGNVQHIDEHGLTMEEVEEILYAAGHGDLLVSRTSGRPIAFGWTSTGKYIAVVFEIVDENPLTVRPVTAYETEE